MGGGTGYTFDPISGKIKVSTNAMGEQTLCGYDVMGNLISQTDGNGNTLFFEYNSRNLPIKRIDAGGRTGEEGSYQYDLKKVESYAYYPDGTLKETKDRNGVVTTTAWDIRGNQTQKSAESLTVTNTYDSAGNKTGMQDITGKTSRAYDGLNRVIIKAVPKVGTNAYLYDVPTVLTGGGYGLAEITKDAMGKETKRIFDKAGRLVEVIDSDSEKTVYDYYNTGAQKSVSYPGGAKEEYLYYPNGQLKQLTNTAGGHTDTYTSEYDAAGRIIKKTENQSTSPRGITTYAYDRAGRLITVTEPNDLSGTGTRKIEYTYDKAGNRLRQVTTDGASIKSLMYEYNEQNRLMRTVEQEIGGKVQTTEYFYDNNGNQLYFKKEEVAKILDPLNPPTAKFSAFVLGQTTVEQNPMVAWVGSNKYDAFNQLIATKGAGGSIESRYNGEGYRTVKIANGVTTYGLYEGDKLVLETDNSGKEKVRTTYGLNAINRTDNGDKVFYLYNPHADVVNLVSGSSVVATYAYDAFGNPVAGTEWAGIDDEKKAGIRYAGYQYDSESGYYYLNARMYDPKTARFLQEDTYRGKLEDPLSLNLYTYCHNDPIQYIDPTGHSIAGIIRGAISAAKSVVTSASKSITSGSSSSKSSSNKSVDPSGTYYPDGSFTPISSGGSSNSRGSSSSGNGSTGTVSRDVMDSYYKTLNAIGSEPERLSFANYAQIIMSDIDRNVQYSKDSSTINIKDGIIPSGMTLSFIDGGVRPFVAAGKSQGGKYYENPKQTYSLFPGYTLVGWGVNGGASGLNLSGDVSLVWFDKSKFAKPIQDSYRHWELPFVYKSYGFDIDGKGSATTAVEFGEAMLANKNYKLKASLSGQAVGIFRKDGCEDFDPEHLTKDAKNYGATVAYAKVDVSFQKDGDVTVVKVGPSTPTLNLNLGASYTTLWDKDESNIFFTPKPYELAKDK